MLGSVKQPATPEELVIGVDQLVSLPEVCFLVNDLVNDPLSEVNEIGQVIAQDPDLTARLLRLVNSPYYGFTSRVETVSRAVVLVGLRELQQLVWASSAVETFAKLPAKKANMAAFWRHSVFTAVTARLLARECHILHPERLFVAGLLHDFGQLLIMHKLPEAALSIMAFKERGMTDHEAESKVLGYDHTAIAHALFERWGLPESLRLAIDGHHNPSTCKKFPMEASLVCVADLVAHTLETGNEENLIARIDPFAWATLGITETRLKSVMQEAVMQFLETLELLLPGAVQRM